MAVVVTVKAKAGQYVHQVFFHLFAEWCSSYLSHSYCVPDMGYDIVRIVGSPLLPHLKEFFLVLF